MKALFARWYIRLLPAFVLLVVLVGCDEDDEHLSPNGIIDVIYAIGDVVLAILDTIFAAT